MNAIVNNLLLVGDKFTPEMLLKKQEIQDIFIKTN